MNVHLFRIVNAAARHTPRLHAVAAGYAVYGVALFALLLLTGWWVARHDGSLVMAAALWAPLAVLVALAVNQPIVHAIHEARPYATLPHVLVLVPRSTDPSEPSDHATMAAAAAAGVFPVRRWLGFVTAAAALLMGADRVYVGAHYPGDIGAGFLLGIAVAVAGYLLVRPLLARLVAWLRGTRLRPLLAAGPAPAVTGERVS